VHLFTHDNVLFHALIEQGQMAKVANLNMAKAYNCSAGTIRCSNIDPDAKIAFLDDKGAIAVAKDLDSSNILSKSTRTARDSRQSLLSPQSATVNRRSHS
jgi:hypothetical protein